MNDLDRRRAVAVMIGILVPALLAYVGVRVLLDEPVVARHPGIVVGEAGGEVVSTVPSPSVTPSPTASPTEQPTPRATVAAAPTATPVAPSEPAVAAPQPTDAEVAAEPPPATEPPAPAGPAPTPPPPATPPPGGVAVAGDPSDAVAAFYRRVSDGSFDAAYALWSDRMKATYPRQENLDGRFANTASVTFTELRVASQSETTATVQANFVERYDGGGSREFVGYWQLVRVGGAWLLDAPTY
jgi:hypothetical protein